jgi:TetR/AcrR family transcriptional regulator, cholesterol catabolism regulator
MIAAVRRKPRPIDPAELDGNDSEAPPTRGDLIRAAARRHFAEHGYDAASMREIAADAGITIATLYFHCATKEQLLFDVLERAMDRLSLAVTAALASAGPRWSDRLAAAIRVHIEFCARGDYGATISTSELRGLTGELRERHIATRDRYEQLFRDLVAGGIDAREFAPADVALIAAGILSIGLGVGRWFRPGARLTTDQIAAEYTRFALDGLRLRPAAARGGSAPVSRQSAPVTSPPAGRQARARRPN